MPTTNSITDLLNETAWQQARDAQAAREASYAEGSNRNVSGVMGKNDFLMLLATQLRYQDPLDPQSDSDFAAQLAQFSSLEQMQNMNTSLAAMASYQAYSLVGKYVIAKAIIDGAPTEIPGIVDCVFTRDGVTYAQIGEYTVPMSSITDVFDSAGMPTPDSLIRISDSLIGRIVCAQQGDKVVEGVVTRVAVSQGVMYAFIDDGSGEQRIVSVNNIFDIRQSGTPKTELEKAKDPDDDDETDIVPPPEGEGEGDNVPPPAGEGEGDIVPPPVE